MDAPLIANWVALLFKGTFFLLLLTFTVYSIFIIYHWFAYGTNKKLAMRATTIYLAGGVLTLLVMLMSGLMII